MTNARRTENVPWIPSDLLSPQDLCSTNSIFSKPSYYRDHPEFHTPNPHLRLFPRGFRIDTTAIGQTWAFDDDERSEALKTRRLTKDEERLLFLQFNYARSVVYRLRKHRKLTVEQVKKMIKWQQTSDEVRNILWVVNLPLIITIAKSRRYTYHSNFLDDLFPAGQDGLQKAIYYYDLSTGWAFSTYAYQAVLRCFWRAMELAGRAYGCIEKRPGKDPVQKKVFFFEDDPSAVKYEPADSQFWDRIHEQEDEDLMWRSVQDAVRYLSPIQQTVIRRRLGLSRSDRRVRSGMTLGETGEILDLSRERIRQIEAKAIQLMRKRFAKKDLLSAALAG